METDIQQPYGQRQYREHIAPSQSIISRAVVKRQDYTQRKQSINNWDDWKAEMRSKWRLFLFVGLVLLLTSLVVGCAESYTQEDLDAIREAGYSEGYTVGKAEGYEAGSLEGYKVGYTEGKDVGFAEYESVQATPQIDNTPPVIEQITISTITEIEAVISWLTDEPASSKVTYGLTSSSVDFSTVDNDLSSTPSIELKWLQPDTEYHYKIYSLDAYGNEAITDANKFRTRALPPDKGIMVGTVLYPDGTPAHGSFVYLFKGEESISFAVGNTDKEGHYTFTNLPLGYYEIYSSFFRFGVPGEGVEKGFEVFHRPPQIANVIKNHLTIAPIIPQLKEIKLRYRNEYLNFDLTDIINTNQPEFSWDIVPKAAYYKVRISDTRFGEEDRYIEEITVTNARLIWPTPLVGKKMNYYVWVYAFDASGNYLTHGFNLLWIGPPGD